MQAAPITRDTNLKATGAKRDRAATARISENGSRAEQRLRWIRHVGLKPPPPDLGKDQEHSKAFWEQAAPKNNVIGIGGGRNYTLYARATDHIEGWIAGEPAPKPQGGALVTYALIQTKPTARRS